MESIQFQQIHWLITSRAMRAFESFYVRRVTYMKKTKNCKAVFWSHCNTGSCSFFSTLFLPNIWIFFVLIFQHLSIIMCQHSHGNLTRSHQGMIYVQHHSSIVNLISVWSHTTFTQITRFLHWFQILQLPVLQYKKSSIRNLA